ncbi:MAG: T9SS type A sorting domain-containing protein [Tannerella sp.]|jgi:hypothetical protein|nr:T9SS type A sorting domain-containing protein [Tannerella sp.]
MKKFILLLSLFPWLLPAQVSRSETAKTSMLRMMNRPSVTRGVALRAETAGQQPDSTYTFYDGELHRRVGFTYNEEGWVTLEEGYTDFNYDGLANEKLKLEYTYTREDGYLVQDGISSLQFIEGVWQTYARAVVHYNANGMPVRSCSYFSLGEGVWELNSLTATVAYNEKGNPVTVMDSIPFGKGLKATRRHELHYDRFDRLAGYDRFDGGETEGEWVLHDRVEITYEGADKCVESYFKPVGNENWEVAYLLETLFDERGNIIAETEKIPDGHGGYTTQWSNTFRHVYLSDGGTSAIAPEASPSSTVYPNPSTGFVTVRIRDAAPAMLTLVDMSGRVVARQAVGQQASIALDSLPRGFYLLKVATARGTDVHKLILK